MKRLRTALAGAPWGTLREAGWVLAGQGIATVASIGLTKVVASRLGAEEYGRYALGLTLAVLLNQFLLGPIITSSLRFFALFRDEGRLFALLAALRGIVGVGTAVVVMLTVPASLFVSARFGRESALLLVASATFGLAQNVFSLLNGLDIAARHRARAALYQAADPVLRLTVAGVVLAVGAHTAASAMIAVSGGMTIALIVQGSTLARAFRPALAIETSRPTEAVKAARQAVLGYAVYFVVAGGFSWLQLSSDRWAIKFYLDNASVGLYAVAYQIASIPAVILAGCVSQFITPIVFQRAQAGTSATAIRSARRAIFVGVAALVLLTVVAAAVAAAVGDRLIVIFTSSAYVASAVYIAPLVLGLGLLQIGHMLSLLPMSSNRLRGHLAVKVVHGAAAVVLNALTVRRFGLAGLCTAVIVGGIIYVALVLLNNQRIMRTFTPKAVPPIEAPLLQL